MLICPFCQAELPADAGLAVRCPSCGGLLSWQDDEGDSFAGEEFLGHEAGVSVAAQGTVVPTAKADVESTPPTPAPEQPKKGKGTEKPGSTFATIDVPTSAAAASGRDGSRGTHEPQHLSQDDLEQLRTIWKGSVADSNPSTSLKSDTQGEGKSGSTLVIRSRALRESMEGNGDGVDYELLDRIGEGGMGVVYAARQASIDRTVAKQGRLAVVGT